MSDSRGAAPAVRIRAFEPRGVGTALVEHGIATTKGAVAFELEVTPDNRRAHALYERLGFRPVRNASLRRMLG